MAVAFGSMEFFGEMFQFFLTFLLIFTVGYGILWKAKFLSDRSDVNAVVAFAIALTTAMSGVVPFLITLIPYYMIMFLVIFMIFMFGKFLNVKMEEVMMSKYVAIPIVLVFVIITAVIGWQQYSTVVMAQINQTNQTNITQVNLTGNIITDTINNYNYQCVQTGAYAQPIVGPNFLCIVLHPRVLSMIIILVVMAAVVAIIMYMAPKK